MLDRNALLSQWIPAARAGDDAAIDELCRLLLPEIRRYASRQLGPRLRSRVEPDEIADTALLEALRALDSLPAVGADHALRNRVRQRVRWRVQDAIKSQDPPIQDAGVDVDSIPKESEPGRMGPVTLKDWEVEVLARLAVADPLWSSVLRLYVLEGRSFEDTAKELDISRRKATECFYRACRYLGDDGQGPHLSV